MRLGCSHAAPGMLWLAVPHALLQQVVAFLAPLTPMASCALIMAAQSSMLNLGALLRWQVNEAYIADLSAQQDETEAELQLVREELQQAQAKAAEALGKMQAKSEQAHRASAQVRLLLTIAGLLALQTAGI